MHTLYLLSVYLHILAATVWVGGIAFLVFVVVPWLRSGGQRIAGEFLRETGLRFRSVGWVCFALLLLTGSFNLWVRGVRFESFTDPAWLSSSFGKTVVLKLAVFCAILIVSLVHDFVVGPQATKVLQEGAPPEVAMRLRRRAQRLGRLNALFALAIVALAIFLVRGAPW